MDHSHDEISNLRLAFVLNLGFAIVEIGGGLAINSFAVISDALHDLGDAFSLGLAWYLSRYAQRERTERYSFGYRRFSLLGALINAIVLIVGSLAILSQAVPRLLNPQHPSAPGMLILAGIGITVNGIAALRLRHGATLNAQMVTWHLFEDVLGWIAVLVVGVTLLFADLPILDPILSILITIYVLYGVVKRTRTTLSLFLQAVPEAIDLSAIEHEIRSLPNVASTHHTHVWSLDGEHHILTTHVVMRADVTREQVLQAKAKIRELTSRMNLVHTTIEVEFQGQECPQSASSCRGQNGSSHPQ
jgi:cobalt-zinc-cadmium efflux system protein